MTTQTENTSSTSLHEPVYGPTESYGPLTCLGPSVYTIDGEWQQGTFKRRMTLLQLANNDLVVHSPIHLTPEDYREIDTLGRVAYIVAPNTFHSDEAHFFKNQYPGARLYGSIGSSKKLTKLKITHDIIPAAWPESLVPEIEILEIQGTRMVHENVFFHKSSRTLIVTDLIFNLDLGLKTNVNPLELGFLKLNQIYKQCGPSLIFRFGFIKDTSKAKESIKQIFNWDFDRVIMNHGTPILHNGQDVLKRGFKRMGLMD